MSILPNTLPVYVDDGGVTHRGALRRGIVARWAICEYVKGTLWVARYHLRITNTEIVTCLSCIATECDEKV